MTFPVQLQTKVQIGKTTFPRNCLLDKETIIKDLRELSFHIEQGPLFVMGDCLPLLPPPHADSKIPPFAKF